MRAAAGDRRDGTWPAGGDHLPPRLFQAACMTDGPRRKDGPDVRETVPFLFVFFQAGDWISKGRKIQNTGQAEAV